MAPRALVRRPGNALPGGIVTHIERRPIDLERALEEWTAYVAALARAGWEPVEVAPADACPDAVFVEDALVVHDGLAVLTRPGAVERRPELAGAEETARSLGLRLGRIEPPGTLDGGDVLKVGDTVYVGLGGRTNEEGIRQLREALAPEGARVVAVPVTRVLHLKSAVTALPDGTVIGYPPLVDDSTVFPRFLPVAEESGSHVVLLGDDALLMSTDCPQTAQQFAGLGYRPVTVDIGEFQKLEGCVTCLSVRLRGRE
jgi:dimethylargininase